VTDIRGRLLFNFGGSACDGYTLETRLVTAIVDREGKASLTDIKTDSFEQGNGGSYRFQSSQSTNSQITEAARGLASRKEKPPSIVVDVQKPAKSRLTLPGTVLFPTQHSLAILDIAREGGTRLHADFFDGSEKGTKVYQTTAFIGKPLMAGANKSLPGIKNGAALDDLVSWPVVISYYDDKQSREGVPVYEISFRLYANGVTRKLKLDYGTFSMSGDLASIEFPKPRNCVQKSKPNS
jgi:hypothetical protein